MDILKNLQTPVDENQSVNISGRKILENFTSHENGIPDEAVTKKDVKRLVNVLLHAEIENTVVQGQLNESVRRLRALEDAGDRPDVVQSEDGALLIISE